jgi:hypothetical protein
MSDAAELLSELRYQGFTISPKGDAVRVSPATRLTPELRERIRRHKPGLLALIRGPHGNCDHCGRPLDDKRRCWRCCDRVCVDCGGWTGSAFIQRCVTCGFLYRDE